MDLHTDDTEGVREHLEHIPWSDLTVHRREIPRWWAYVAAGVVATAALGVVAARSFHATTAPVQEAVVATTAMTTTVPAALPAAAPLYSEADLMALVPGSQEQLAAARAVWFVRDYFGSGGNPEAVAGVLAALPAHATIDSPDDTGASYVEWVAPFGVQQLGGNLYRVEVLFGMLGGENVSTLVRLAPKAVAIVVEVDGGRTGVVDLPIPVELPTRADVTAWPDPGQEVPATVANAAEQEASMWGSDPEVVAASRGDDGWRVEVTVADEVGNRWPVAVWVDDAGPIDTPPWDTGG